MVRILGIVIWATVTIYAITDWLRTPEDQVPAKLPKNIWLLLIILTIPSLSIGSIAWIALRFVAKAEAGEAPISFSVTRVPSEKQTPAPLAPDDNPEFLFRLERDIQRQRKKASKESANASNDSAPDSPSAFEEGSGASDTSANNDDEATHRNDPQA